MFFIFQCRIKNLWEKNLYWLILPNIPSYMITHPIKFYRWHPYDWWLMTGRTDLITMIDGCRRGEGGGDHRAGQSHSQGRRRRGELRRRRWSEGDGRSESTGWWCCYCYWGGQRSLLAKYYYYYYCYHDTQPDLWLYILSRNLYLSPKGLSFSASEMKDNMFSQNTRKWKN